MKEGLNIKMIINWSNVFDWMILFKCFITGGIICIIGQILIDKTKLTPARILVIFVTTGVILGGLGIYKYLVDLVFYFGVLFVIDIFFLWSAYFLIY